MSYRPEFSKSVDYHVLLEGYGYGAHRVSRTATVTARIAPSRTDTALSTRVSFALSRYPGLTQTLGKPIGANNL